MGEKWLALSDWLRLGGLRCCMKIVVVNTIEIVFMIVFIDVAIAMRLVLHVLSLRCVLRVVSFPCSQRDVECVVQLAQRLSP